MFFLHMLPSWDQMEQRMNREANVQRVGHFRTHWNEPVASPSLIRHRFHCVRVAFERAGREADPILRQRFADLDIGSVIDDLIDVVSQMAMIVVGSALAGGLLGAGVGTLFFGAGAFPVQ
ncbi:hypothetical protein PSFL111601_18745 [Pseudomonas floridensis]|nr:hypothetical protein [Pseudomonas floridensis]